MQKFQELDLIFVEGADMYGLVVKVSQNWLRDYMYTVLWADGTLSSTALMRSRRLNLTLRYREHREKDPRSPTR